MELKTYHFIQSQLDFRRRTGMLLRHFFVDALLLGAAFSLLLRGGWAEYCVAQVVLAVVFFRGFSLMHEAVHHSAADARLLNALAGLVGGILCFMPYHSWKYLHLEHHQWAGNVDQDPSAKLRKDYDPAKKMKYRILSAIWKSWIPLLGLMQEIVFWVYPIQQFKNPIYRWQVKFWIGFSAMVPIATYGALAWWWPALFHLSHFAPAGVLYLMMVELINFPHHMDVPAYRGRKRLLVMEQYKVSRSSYYPAWFSRNFLLNFNLHSEHHLFPRLPWYQLDKARGLVKAALGQAYHESIGNEWVRKNRSRNLEELLPTEPDYQEAITKKAA